VSSIAVDSSDSTGNTVYVGTTGGGVWKSINAAAATASQVTFAPLTDTLSAYNEALEVSLSVGALSVQPVSAGTVPVILAGTGDPNDATDSYYGAGILRSVDGGTTWTSITQSDDEEYGGRDNFIFDGDGFSGFAWGSVNASPVVVAAVSQATIRPISARVGGWQRSRTTRLKWCRGQRPSSPVAEARLPQLRPSVATQRPRLSGIRYGRCFTLRCSFTAITSRLMG
jgi:hypothetical protein